jgi:hypothetical protein
MKDKRNRFLTVAQYRTNQILKYIRLLSNCSNKNNYEYTEAEITKIFSAIDEELRISKLKYKSRRKRSFQL